MWQDVAQGLVRKMGIQGLALSPDSYKTVGGPSPFSEL